MHHNEKSIFWFRRDLRLTDNHGLYLALKESKKVFCIFIFDSNILSKLQDKDDRRVSFIWESICELQNELRKIQQELFILHGDPEELVPKLAEIIDAQAVYTNRDYEGYPLKRDEYVHAKLSELNKHLITVKDHIIFESTEVTKADGKPYTVFTPYKRAWIKTLNKDFAGNLRKYDSHKQIDKNEKPSIREVDNIYKSLKNTCIQYINEIEDIGFKKTPIVVQHGISGAEKIFKSFLKNKITGYKKTRDLPWYEGTSNLSVHLRFGTISIRECYRKAYEVLGNERSPEAQEGINTWISELIWREFYSMVLQAFPYVEEKSFKKEYQNLVWRVDDKLLTAWQNGMTGYPIVDAGMRQLRTTGQIHNRARMIVASFLTKDLLIDWQKGERHFARYLLDFELASNNGGWQWAASTGTDAVPYFRIFNPQLQGEKFDPEAEYIKRYVPELKDVAAKKIHKLDFAVKDYPKPIVRREETKEAVINLFKTAKSKKTKKSN